MAQQAIRVTRNQERSLPGREVVGHPTLTMLTGAVSTWRVGCRRHLYRNAKDTTRGRSILVEMLGSAVGNSSFRCKIAALQLQRRDYF